MPTASAVTKTNYTLIGWNDGTATHDPGATFTMPAKDVTLKAVWQENGQTGETEYALTYNLNGGTGIATGGDFAEGETVTLPSATDVTKANHTLTGWNDGTTTHAPGATFTMPASAVTLTAVWQENGQTGETEYTVTFNPNNADEPQITSVKVNAGSTVAKPTPDPVNANGKEFRYWVVDDETNMPYDFSRKVTGNLALIAEYAYHIRFDLNGGSGTAEDKWVKVWGRGITLPASTGLTNGSKVFAGWKLGTEVYEAGEQFTTPAGNHTFVAQWEEAKEGYTVSFSTQFRGEGTPPESLLNQKAGATITLPANTFTPSAGNEDYEFVGWYITGESSSVVYQPGDTYTMPNKDVDFKAKWERKKTSYTVTYKAGDHGTGADIVLQNQSGNITLKPANTFIADNEYRFGGWCVEGDTEVLYAEDKYALTSNTVFVAQWLHTYVGADITYVAMLELLFDTNEGLFVIYSEEEEPIEENVSFTKSGENIHITVAGNTFDGTFVNNVLNISITYNATDYVFGTPDAPTITFDANGGSGNAPTVTPQISGGGYKITLPQNTFTAPANKKFKCWQIGSTEYAVGAQCAVEAGATVTVQAIWEDIPEVTGIVFVGRCTTPTQGSSSPIAGGGATFTKFVIDFDTNKLTYFAENESERTIDLPAANPNYMPDKYGDTASYYHELYLRTSVGGSVSYNLLVNADKTKIWLCDSDDNPLSNGEFTKQSADNEWVQIDMSENSEFYTMCKNGEKLYFSQPFVYADTTFVGIHFSYNSSLGCRIKAIYLNSSGVETEPTAATNYASVEGTSIVFGTDSTTYKVALSQKSDGTYYVTSFRWKTTNPTDTTERALQATKPE